MQKAQHDRTRERIETVLRAVRASTCRQQPLPESLRDADAAPKSSPVRANPSGSPAMQKCSKGSSLAEAINYLFLPFDFRISLLPNIINVEL